MVILLLKRNEGVMKGEDMKLFVITAREGIGGEPELPAAKLALDESGERPHAVQSHHRHLRSVEDLVEVGGDKLAIESKRVEDALPDSKQRYIVIPRTYNNVFNDLRRSIEPSPCGFKLTSLSSLCHVSSHDQCGAFDFG